MKIIRKVYIFIGLLVCLIVLLFSNPTKQDYLQFSEEQHGTMPPVIETERINFYLFSTYAPKRIHTDEYGTVHLGIMGYFFRISDGQYDYPWWLQLFD